MPRWVQYYPEVRDQRLALGLPWRLCQHVPHAGEDASLGREAGINNFRAREKLHVHEQGSLEFLRTLILTKKVWVEWREVIFMAIDLLV